MVSEVTNILYAGIISGWLVAISKPICDQLVLLFAKVGFPKPAGYILIYTIWLIALLALILIIYR